MTIVDLQSYSDSLDFSYTTVNITYIPPLIDLTERVVGGKIQLWIWTDSNFSKLES